MSEHYLDFRVSDLTTNGYDTETYNPDELGFIIKEMNIVPDDVDTYNCDHWNND